MLENIKKVDKKVLMMLGVVVGIILLLMIAIIVVSLTGKGHLSYSKIEDKMVAAAKDYYAEHDNLLPNAEKKSVEVSVSDLVSGGYLKDLSKYTSDSVSCTGKVLVGKTESDYDYVASLNCGDEYKTEFLSDKLIETVVNSGSGLYKMDEVVKPGKSLGVDESGYDLATNELLSGYIYRGEILNNYVKLDDKLYQIVQIDGNNDFVVIDNKAKVRGPYDDRYNSEADQNYGINDYTVSRAYEALKTSYDELKNDSLLKKKAVAKNICIGSRSDDDTATDGSLECARVMTNQYYSLLPVYMIMNASLSDKCANTISVECSNYNFLVKDVNYWTMTPSSANSYTSYRINASLKSSRDNFSSLYRGVYYLTNRLRFVSGTGTENDPYVVK